MTRTFLPLSRTDPDYAYTRVDRRSEDNPELLQKVMMISRLLRGRQLGVASGLLMPVHRQLGDQDAMRTRKRGPTSCINNCLTGGMSFVRCKSMCHW
ncbi:hypothetical protein LSH36_432g02037 [Paralvinella palmiformis]|uniref:Uncharacterized protein n=1 Tax=Paralvinella palmiformis TaxID=53620 RepID=A0AAD9JBR7_9ANNE|nr:hypothetical protein LSH36_432g02037 [Paralvinella palmiformis]